ncbi:MAG: ABC transporter ATP-binding protein [Deltaproteobacteria bacterium]|nr:ABC transporter ATP-binding protein [Deltaproteobacteria bacterium]MBW1993635.1 ABC transporter ATP-binding protein [Deltaproteobacteria bacterium]
MSEKLLRVKDLHTHFFTPEGIVKAVDGVSFDIARGQTLGILGESGCGKSVTALSIMRLIPDPPGRIRKGAILMDGQDLLQASESEMRNIRGNRISMIFQEPMTSLNPVYTIGNQISETYVIHQNMNLKDALNQSIEMLKMVGIPAPEKRAHEYPHQLSGGMRQRAMIAMAMACKPKLLIADEPTTALDVTIQAQILNLMLHLQEELGMAIMMITHDLGVIAEMSDHVVVMYAGEVVEYSPIDILFTQSLHPYTTGLMKSIPKLGSKFKEGKTPLQEIPGVVPNLIRMPPGCLFAPRCNRVMKQCNSQRPPMFIINDEHGAKCWLVEREAKGRLSSSY